MVPKHNLLKYFTLTFTRHKSSKFEGSGPPLKSKDTQFAAVTPVAGLIFETKNRAIFLERFFGRGITAQEHLPRAKNSLDF